MQWPRRGGDLLLWMLVGLPLAAALPRLGMPEARVESALSWLGHASGILALALMLLAAAVSLRVPGSDRPFGGLTRLWRVHHWLGYWAFILVMVHVLALALAALPVSLEAAVALLVPPPVQVAFWLGWLAWLALVIFLAPTFGFFGRPHYQRWKRLHLVSAVALLLALAHALPWPASAGPGSCWDSRGCRRWPGASCWLSAWGAGRIASRRCIAWPVTWSSWSWPRKIVR